MFLGVLRYDWLDAWFKAGMDETARLSLIVEFCCIDIVKKKMSACALTFWIAGRGFAPVANDERLSLAMKENDPICLYWFMGSTYEKKPSAVLETVKEYVDEPSLFDSICKAMTIYTLHMRVLLSVCAVQLLCMESYPEELIINKTSNDTVVKLVNTWSVGLRTSRVYSIQSEALPRGYKRVLQSDALCCSLIHLLDKGCAFWVSIKNQITDDDSLENIVDMYFPDDIPDEWSTESRLKSHPLTLDVYKIQIHPESRIKKVFGSKCIVNPDWFANIKILFKTCRVPDM